MNVTSVGTTPTPLPAPLPISKPVAADRAHDARHEAAQQQAAQQAKKGPDSARTDCTQRTRPNGRCVCKWSEHI